MIAVKNRSLRVGLNAAARFGAQLWAKLLALLLAPLIIRLASVEVLGQYLMALTVVGLLTAATDCGLSVYLTREGAKTQEAEGQRRLLGDILVMKGALAILGYVLLLTLGPLLPLPSAIRQILPLAGLAVIPEAATAAIHAFFNARQRMDVSSGITAVARLVETLGAALALAGPGNLYRSGGAYGLGGAARLILWHVIGSGVGAALSLRILWRWNSPPEIRLTHLVRAGAWRRTLAEALPFAVVGFIAMLYRRLDLLLLGSWHGELVAGWYGAATRLWEAVHLLPASLLDALFPEMSRVAALPDGQTRLRRLLRIGGGGALILGGGLAALGAIGGRYGLRLVYGANVATPTVQTWRLLTWAMPAVFLYLLGGHTLYALGKQRTVTGRMLIVTALNAIINLVLLARWRHIGAAVALLTSEWLLCLLLYGGAWREAERRDDERS